MLGRGDQNGRLAVEQVVVRVRRMQLDRLGLEAKRQKGGNQDRISHLGQAIYFFSILSPAYSRRQCITELVILASTASSVSSNG
jgi:hypothetical protein